MDKSYGRFSNKHIVLDCLRDLEAEIGRAKTGLEQVNESLSRLKFEHNAKNNLLFGENDFPRIVRT